MAVSRAIAKRIELTIELVDDIARIWTEASDEERAAVGQVMADLAAELAALAELRSDHEVES